MAGLLVATLVGLVSSVCGAQEPAGGTSGAGIEAVPYQRVTINGPFWGERLRVLREATLAANRRQCDATGRFANFDRAAKRLAGDAKPGDFDGLLFNDSDVYKVLEGWSYAVANEPDAAKKVELEKDLDAAIARVAAAQLPDGYIDTYYTLKTGLDKRMTNERWDHETYCMGHLIEAGVAHFEATGKRSLLDVAVKAAGYLQGLYGKGYTVPSGHEEVELALVRLAKATGDTKWNDLALKIVELRGRPHTWLDGKVEQPWGDYAQDHAPVAEQFEAAGHAVRAGYLYCAMADLARQGHREYVPALERLWSDVTERRIFVTGGIGPSGHNEGFTVPYDIPTRSAYQETCASIALCMWAHRMFLLTGDGRYMEQFERTLYNAVLAGVSASGDRFFYVNPLESRGRERRQEWFACACCPPNVLRFFGELGQYVYAVKGETVYVNLLMEGKGTVMVGGKPVEIEQTTSYPFGPQVAVVVRNKSERDVTVAFRRMPGLEAGLDASAGDGYARKLVRAGVEERVEWMADMSAKRVYADARVKACAGRVAVMRGPLVYAAEGVDNNGLATRLVLPVGANFTDGTGRSGVPELLAEGVYVRGDDGSGSGGALYRAGGAADHVTITLRPYFMWANRAPSEMAVWLAESAAVLGPAPMEGVKASASFIGNGDGVGALFDRVLPESSGDEGIPRLTFWPHKGSANGGTKEEWVVYEFERARDVGSVGVYWFDDTGHGECRVPAKCGLEYRDDAGAWKALGAVGVKKDEMNRATFNRVRANALRLRVELAPNVSAGVLEWEVGEK